ncbi:MAG: PDZ domain-containing protein [Muribaculaceae bacterium]|nr:PDZ domain-containing protein [Muribaculaceae bacterium]
MIKKIITATSLAALMFTAFSAGAETRSSKRDISRSLDIFTSLFKQLQTSYVDTIDAEKSVTTAINAMLNDIDPYTNYIPESEQEDFMTIATGTYGGIGSMIMQRDGNVYISEPYKGTPSQLAGLRAGDMFLKIDDDTVTGWKSDQVSARLKGQAGTPVSITVKRPYTDDSILTFDITRAKIDIDPVPYYGVTHDNVGYIAITTFNEQTADAVRDALLALKADPRVKSIALDLRGNGGGLMESAVKIVGLFVPKGTEVLRTRGRGELNEQIYKTTRQPVDTEIPLAVLVDDGSASAAEIVTGALQDLDRAVIVGERTFGKGLVQSTRQLPYNGLLKVTIAKYHIPSGRLIQAIDYSHRNPDGSVARIPDSLTNVFYTKAGREVRDGGGITPDVKVDRGEMSRLTYNLASGNTIFDFATKYVAEHPEIASPGEFVVDDSLYNSFKAFVDPDKVQYDKLTEYMLEQLEEVTRREGYMNDSVQAQIDQLKSMLHHNLDRDLDIQRDDIARYIASELITRYYYNPGRYEYLVRDDEDMKEAAAILNDSERYRSILSK